MVLKVYKSDKSLPQTNVFVINTPFLITFPVGPGLVVGRIKTIIKLFLFALDNRI